MIKITKEGEVIITGKEVQELRNACGLAGAYLAANPASWADDEIFATSRFIEAILDNVKEVKNV